jgi:hypothetical protein
MQKKKIVVAEYSIILDKETFTHKIIKKKPFPLYNQIIIIFFCVINNI